MNKILRLYNKQFVIELFTKEVLPLYPDFESVKNVKITAHKNHVWETTYHVVIEFTTIFLDKDGKTRRLPIFCSAHSDEPRKNVYRSLKYLWENGFGQGYLTIPHALFYSDYFQGTFYRGVEGDNLYQFIRRKDLKTVEELLPKAARWFAKLHSIPAEKAENFNPINSLIETVYPGVPHTLMRIKKQYPKYSQCYKELYDHFVKEENKFLGSTKNRWLVHGDAHPENVIKMGRKKTAVIDFTDLCIADFARDLGAFLQQLEFMAMRKIGDPAYAEKLKQLFLDSYFAASRASLSSETKKRIEMYYYWTTIRTATFFLIKYEPEPERGYPLIEKVCANLKINI